MAILLIPCESSHRQVSDLEQEALSTTLSIALVSAAQRHLIMNDQGMAKTTVHTILVAHQKIKSRVRPSERGSVCDG